MGELCVPHSDAHIFYIILPCQFSHLFDTACLTQTDKSFSGSQSTVKTVELYVFFAPQTEGLLYFNIFEACSCCNAITYDLNW